jgi:hypothetical protein
MYSSHHHSWFYIFHGFNTRCLIKYPNNIPYFFLFCQLTADLSTQDDNCLRARVKLLHDWRFTANQFFMTSSSWSSCPDRRAGRLNCCWHPPVQSFLAVVSSRSMTKICVHSQTSTCFEMQPPRSFCVGAAYVAGSFSTSALALEQHAAQLTMHSAPLLSP